MRQKQEKMKKRKTKNGGKYGNTVKANGNKRENAN